jgi:hypothetical protein
MTHDVQAIRDDLAFMRALAQEGRRAPLLIGHNLMVGGLVYGTICVVCWLLATHLVVLPWSWGTHWSPAIWIATTPIYVAYCYVRRTQWRNRRPGATALTNRAVHAAFRGIGYALLTLLAAAVIAAYQMKTMAAFALFPSIIMACYGLGWLVAAAMSETKWLRAVAIASFVAALVIAAAIEVTAGYLAMAAFLYLLVALPGWVLTRAEPSDVV